MMSWWHLKLCSSILIYFVRTECLRELERHETKDFEHVFSNFSEIKKKTFNFFDIIKFFWCFHSCDNLLTCSSGKHKFHWVAQAPWIVFAFPDLTAFWIAWSIFLTAASRTCLQTGLLWCNQCFVSLRVSSSLFATTKTSNIKSQNILRLKFWCKLLVDFLIPSPSVQIQQTRFPSSCLSPKYYVIIVKQALKINNDINSKIRKWREKRSFGQSIKVKPLNFVSP